LHRRAVTSWGKKANSQLLFSGGIVLMSNKILCAALGGFTIALFMMLGNSAGRGAEAVATVADPVIVELFTSQGCSSCPPADAFVEELSHDPDVIALTRPVTYWDRLGWKDSLAREENTALQRAYAARGGVGAGVYTPQTMVQGALGAVGSDRNLVRRQLATARKSIRAAIAIRPGLFAVAGDGGPADVKLVALKSSRVVRIGRGENGGRVVRYSNIVVAETLVGRWNGRAQSFPMPTRDVAGADRYAIIVQDGTGPIIAGRML
jgi:hypothetical protein